MKSLVQVVKPLSCSSVLGFINITKNPPKITKQRILQTHYLAVGSRFKKGCFSYVALPTLNWDNSSFPDSCFLQMNLLTAWVKVLFQISLITIMITLTLLNKFQLSRAHFCQHFSGQERLLHINLPAWKWFKFHLKISVANVGFRPYIWFIIFSITSTKSESVNDSLSKKSSSKTSRAKYKVELHIR